MVVSGPNGYSSDISNNIQPTGTSRFLGSDSYTASTEVIPDGMAGYTYQCNATGAESSSGSVTVQSKAVD